MEIDSLRRPGRNCLTHRIIEQATKAFQNECKVLVSMYSRDVADEEVRFAVSLDRILIPQLIVKVRILGDIELEADAKHLTADFNQSLAGICEHQIVVWQSIADWIVRKNYVEK